MKKDGNIMTREYMTLQQSVIANRQSKDLQKLSMY